MSAAAEPHASLEALSWPFERVALALEALSRAAGLETTAPAAPHRADDQSPDPGRLGTRSGQTEWLEAAARRLGVDAQAVSERYPDVSRLVRSAPPALFALPAADAKAAPRLLAVLRGARGDAQVISPAGIVRIDAERLTQCLAAPIEAGVRPGISELLDAVAIAPRRRRRAERAMLREQLADTSVDGCWLVRAPDHGALSVRELRALLRGVLALLLASIGQYALWAFAWQRVAEGALYGWVDRGQLAGWVIALLTTVPLHAAISWYSARLSLEVGGWLRQRLLGGLFVQGPDAVRGAGIGQLLGRVIEVGAVETLGLGGFILGALGLVDLAIAAVLLANGVSNVWLLALFAGACLFAGCVARAGHRRRQVWNESRLRLTHDLVENMVGQRTRVAQEPRARWHRHEDAALESYLERARYMDRATALSSVSPRLWLIASSAYLGIGVLPNTPSSSLPLALSLAGMLLGYRALTTVSSSLTRLSMALIAGRNVLPLLRATPPAQAHAAPGAERLGAARPAFTLRARELSLSAKNRATALLGSADFTIARGDRILLEGASGSGKSTLARTIAGLATPERGSLLLDGLDRATLGDESWRRRITLTPQFHDNHVFGSTLAFNLLLGRRWPPSSSDLSDAVRVCHELGLGPLLERMPLGLMQIVGETGWQLSHGERNRIFAARALLGSADLVLLDESLSALDPITAMTVLDCAERRASSLLLIAHLDRSDDDRRGP